jgi:hypothetical protein
MNLERVPSVEKWDRQEKASAQTRHLTGDERVSLLEDPSRLRRVLTIVKRTAR